MLRLARRIVRIVHRVATNLAREADGTVHRVGRSVARRRAAIAIRRKRRAVRSSAAAVVWSDRQESAVPDVAVDLDAIDVYRVERFPESGPAPWLDRPDAPRRIDERARAGEITADEAALCRKWVTDGYVVLPNAVAPDILDWVWSAYERRISAGAVTPPREEQFPGDTLPGRVLDPHLVVPEIAELMHGPELRRAVELLLGCASVPFQSITGHKATQQPIHGDSIHMTTYPAGYLVAAWVAFEAIEPGSGPLEYYPGSHRLPYVYSRDVGIADRAMQETGYHEFALKYTPAIRDTIETRSLRPVHFLANQGDVLLWHANLLHGGSTWTDVACSRRSIVFHYFGAGCVCYHDLSGLLSRVHAPGNVGSNRS